MWNLSWPYRRKILFDELVEMQGDVVCLQEVQADHYEQDISPFMISLGYDGIYKPKSREFMGQYSKVTFLFRIFLLYMQLSILLKNPRLMVVPHFGRKINFY